MCGLFGVRSPERDVARLAYFGLFALQHRGQESAGIAVSDEGRLTTLRDMGLVTQVFDEQKLRGLHGQLAIGLGTISVDLMIVVLVTTWIRRRMTNNAWQWWHRVSYVGFLTMFLHSMLSGTDLTSPIIAALSWASAIGIGYYALERLGRALNPARIRA